MANNQQQSIRFHHQKKIYLADRDKIKRMVAGIFKDAHLKVQTINYVFCSDNDLWKINKQYLKHDTYTDIITFDLSERPGIVIADIYISVDRVRENARIVKGTIKDELLRVIFHGALHLTGMTDKTKDQKKAMRMAEDRYLNLYHKRFHETRFLRET